MIQNITIVNETTRNNIKAEREFGKRVVTIRNYGTYSCRNINHAPDRPRGQHATANAIDVAGFVLADGTHISIARDWRDPDANGRFLHAVHDGACASRWHACR